MQYIHTIEYSAIHTGAEVPIYAATWINFKNILSKRNQTQRPCPCLRAKTIETENKFVGKRVSSDWERVQVFFFSDKNIQELDSSE